jgi:hypothetical protein
MIKDLLVAATEDRPNGIDLLAKVGRRRPRPLMPVLAAVCTATAASAGLFFLTPRHDASSVAVTHVGQGFRPRIFVEGKLTEEGVFDPVRHLGVIKGGYGYKSEARIIGDVEYYKGDAMPPGRPWRESARGTLVISPADPEMLVWRGERDPQGVLRYLRSNTAFHGHGTHFTFSALHPLPSSFEINVRFAGTVDLDAQGRLRSLSVTIYPPDPANVRPSGHYLLEISDYGIAVRVTPPPASQVVTDAQSAHWRLTDKGWVYDKTPSPPPFSGGPVLPSQTPR